MKTNCSNKNSGFTLVELLVVIAIIGILASALYLTLNPAQLQRKAKEASLKATMTKVCTALFACAAAKKDATSCDSYEEIGISTAPTEPLGAVYNLQVNPFNATIVGFFGHYTSSASITCQYDCGFDFATGPITSLNQTGSCL